MATDELPTTQTRATLDAAFAAMADDADYQAEALLIAAEFATADWEAWQAREDQADDDL